mmetsp:Transcript_6280/g.15558  ORF Transcript_6280/g.15558 Transcript_6280/m.15558 type:complete len:121 (+) Transcript_6280:90-452(+)
MNHQFDDVTQVIPRCLGGLRNVARLSFPDKILEHSFFETCLKFAEFRFDLLPKYNPSTTKRTSPVGGEGDNFTRLQGEAGALVERASIKTLESVHRTKLRRHYVGAYCQAVREVMLLGND